MEKKMSERKKLFMTINDQGGVGKSTAIKKTVSALRQLGISLSIFDADADHKSTFKTYSSKKKNGEPDEKQNPQTGCVGLNITEKADAVLNALVEPTPVILIDGPARAIQAILEALGPGSAQDFIDTIEGNDGELYLYTPWTDDDKDKKSSISIDKIYNYLENVDFSDYDPDFKIHIIVGFDKGFMPTAEIEHNCMQSYQNNLSIKAMMNDPRFVIHFIEMTARLTQDVLNETADISFDVALEKAFLPASKTVIKKAIKDGSKIAQLLI